MHADLEPQRPEATAITPERESAQQEVTACGSVAADILVQRPKPLHAPIPPLRTE